MYKTKVFVLLLVMIAAGTIGFVRCKKQFNLTQKHHLRYTSALQDIILGFKIKGIDLEPGLRLSYRDGLVPNLDNVHRVTCRQLYPPDSIPSWTLNNNGIYQESIIDKNTLDKSPTWTINILRKDRQTSKYLYSVHRENWWCIYLCCRYDHATRTVCQNPGSEKRCRCVHAVSFDFNSL